MFGYVVPLKPELKIKEYAVYKSFYCGVCKALGKRSCQFCRLSLTYDSAFLALIMQSVSEVKPEVYYEKCIASPIKKQPIIKNSEYVNYAADVNVMLVYHKLKDSIRDDKKWYAYVLAPMVKKYYKKASKRYPEKQEFIYTHLNRLNQLEQNNEYSIDKAAEPFSRIMEGIVQFNSFDKTSNRVLKWLGYNLGKWLYLLDAYDDIDDDLASNSYNVIINSFSESRDANYVKDKSCEEIRFILYTCLTEIEKSIELLDIKQNKSVIDNIVNMGLRDKTDEILDNRRSENGSIQSTGSTQKCKSTRDKAGV